MSYFVIGWSVHFILRVPSEGVIERPLPDGCPSLKLNWCGRVICDSEFQSWGFLFVQVLLLRSVGLLQGVNVHFSEPPLWRYETECGIWPYDTNELKWGEGEVECNNALMAGSKVVGSQQKSVEEELAFKHITKELGRGCTIVFPQPLVGEGGACGSYIGVHQIIQFCRIKCKISTTKD